MAKKDKVDLAEFLIRAKQNTYASGAKERNLLGGGKQFYFKDGILSYWDTFYGFVSFVGQELVQHRKKGFIWAMNYFGGLIFDKETSHTEMPRASSDETYGFLKKALRSPNIKAPYRGPAHFSDGEWVYKNEWKAGSSIREFKGTELIYYKHLLVYRCDYHGGFIKEE